jgi:ribosomal protein S25
MKINQKDTSIDHYHKAIEGDFEASQNARVYAQIKKHEFITGGMISNNYKLRISDTGRSLNSLHKEGLIERAYKDKCKDSKVTVWYWQLKKKVEKPDPGIQARMNF